MPDDLPQELRQLVQGLITQDYVKRWGNDEVERWLRGEEVPVHYQSVNPSVSSYQFSRSHAANSAEDLSQILKTDLDRAVRQLYSSKISAWVNLFNQGLASDLDQVTEEDYATDHGAGLQKAIYILDQSEPYFCPYAGSKTACFDKGELATAVLSSFNRYQQGLTSSGHAFYLYLEAHGQKDIADTYRRLFTSYSPRKALHTVILELLGKDTILVNGTEIGAPEQLLTLDDEDALAIELRDPDSWISVWISKGEFEDVDDRLASWRQVDWNKISLDLILSHEDSEISINKRHKLTGEYIAYLADKSERCIKGNRDAFESLERLYVNSEFIAMGRLLHEASFPEIHHEWNISVKQFLSERAALEVKSLHGIDTEDEIIYGALLLGSLFKKKPEYKQSLLDDVNQVIPSDWRCCDWYSEIGDPKLGESSTKLLLLREFAPIAQQHIAAENRAKEQERIDFAIGVTKAFVLSAGAFILGSTASLVAMAIPAVILGVIFEIFGAGDFFSNLLEIVILTIGCVCSYLTAKNTMDGTSEEAPALVSIATSAICIIMYNVFLV